METQIEDDYSPRDQVQHALQPCGGQRRSRLERPISAVWEAEWSKKDKTMRTLKRNIERDAAIVAAIKSKTWTVSEVANLQGISRSRIYAIVAESGHKSGRTWLKGLSDRRVARARAMLILDIRPQTVRSKLNLTAYQIRMLRKKLEEESKNDN